MKTLIAMLVICWMPQADSSLKEVWRIEDQVPLDHCLQMQAMFAGGGRAAAITVRCGDSKAIYALVTPKYETTCNPFMQGLAAFFHRAC